MIKALNPESLDVNEITESLKWKDKTKHLTGEALQRAIATELSVRKQENFNYKASLFLNLFLGLVSLICAILTIINVFKGNWNFVVGFAIVTYAAFWVFRRIPWPMSRAEKNAAELSMMMRQFGNRYR